MNKLIIPAAATAFVAGLAVIPTANTNALDPECNSVSDESILTKCINNASDGDTITLGGAKFEVEATQTIKKDITLNLNGGHITYKQSTKNLFEVEFASLDITGNGIIETTEMNSANSQTVAVLFKGNTGKHLNIGQGVTLKGQVPLYFSSTSKAPSNVDVSGTILGTSGNDAAIFAPHNLTSAIAPTVVVHSPARVENIAGGPAASLGGYTDFTSDGATFIGGTGIGIGAGKLTLKGNTKIYANGSINKTFNNEDYVLPTSGAAIQVVRATNFGPSDPSKNKMNFVGGVEIIIEDGEYTSANGSPIADLYYTDDADPKSGLSSIRISGGTFESEKPDTPLIDSTDETFAQKNFISGGTFLSGGAPMSISSDYLDGDYVEDPLTGVVMTKTDYQALLEERAAANNAEDPGNPDTADSIALYVTIAAVALLGLGATALLAKKSRR